MSLVKKVGIGLGIGVAVIGLGYFGYKKIRGKEEEVIEDNKKEDKDNIQKYYDDLLDKCKLTEEEVQELSDNYFNKKK